MDRVDKPAKSLCQTPDAFRAPAGTCLFHLMQCLCLTPLPPRPPGEARTQSLSTTAVDISHPFSLLYILTRTLWAAVSRQDIWV